MIANNQCGIFSSSSVELTKDDILSAMKSISGYIDITPSDFQEIYKIAFRHAIERLSRLVKAEDIMTRDVVSVAQDTLLSETAAIMEAANVSGVPVVDGDNFIMGIISEKDFLEKMGGKKNGSFMGVIAECLSNRGCVAMPIREKSAKDVMTFPVITAQRSNTISELSKMLAEHQINRIPVVDGKGRLVGIVSRGDIVESYCAKVF
ncbi:CBS domain containing membrane protein [Desulfatibacillum aliphaticivorans]|uniref:CBS domain containing membrane protein n=2 Tax=Desulfatibacillum aliphaticivorans TaxID=218208 RepID=B8FC49_DESAL|nr:CBS domain containing membrane protein [Desulfatibacillum aliphaticivorans]